MSNIELSFVEEQTLRALLIDRLLHNWSFCDMNHGTVEYEVVTDECTTIKQIAEKLRINLGVEVNARF